MKKNVASFSTSIPACDMSRDCTSISHVEPVNEIVEPRRSKRPKTSTDFGPDFLTYPVTHDGLISEEMLQAFMIEEDPKTFIEAMKYVDVNFWKEAINSEIKSIMANHTWELVDLPNGCKPMGCKWVFRRKLKPDGSIDKLKARLVALGCTQKPGLDHFDTYAPVTNIATI